MPTLHIEYIVVQLDFDTMDASERFKNFLESVVWKSEDLSPALAGTPRARLLREADFDGELGLGTYAPGDLLCGAPPARALSALPSGVA